MFVPAGGNYYQESLYTAPDIMENYLLMPATSYKETLYIGFKLSFY
jgi:hypothetical protein